MVFIQLHSVCVWIHINIILEFLRVPMLIQYVANEWE